MGEFSFLDECNVNIVSCKSGGEFMSFFADAVDVDLENVESGRLGCRLGGRGAVRGRERRRRGQLLPFFKSYRRAVAASGLRPN